MSIFKYLLPLSCVFMSYFLLLLWMVYFSLSPLKSVQLKQFIQMIGVPRSAEYLKKKKKKLSHTLACVCATFSLALETEKERQPLKASSPETCHLCSVKSLQPPPPPPCTPRKPQTFPHNGVINPHCWFRKCRWFVNSIGAWVGLQHEKLLNIKNLHTFFYKNFICHHSGAHTEIEKQLRL